MKPKADRKAPKIPIGTKVGRRANLAVFALSALASVTQAATFIALGRALGDVIAGDPPNWQLVVATICSIVSALAHLVAQVVARAEAVHEEGRLRRRVLGHLISLGPARTTEVRTGATVSTLTDGAERVALYRQTFLPQAIASGLAPALVLILVAVTVDPVPALVLLVAVVVIPLLIVGFQRAFRKSSSASRKERANLAARYLDAIQGLTTLVLARAARRTEASLRVAGEENRQAVMRLLAGNQVVILVTDALFSLFLVSAATVAALLRLQAGAIGVGDALALVLVAYVLLEPLDQVGAFFYVGMGGLANQRAMRRILGIPAERGGGDPAATADSVNVVEVRGASLGWGDEPVLSDVDLTVARGEHLAIVGASGAGKSTLLAALSGDLLPASGSVVIDDVALTGASRHAVRERSALVAQSTWLFTGTIADNLRIAKPDATEDEMWAALSAANLEAEVRLMPAGLNTELGEQGMGLSGGQAQRMSLARAVLSGRRLLLLDEPTSQVDLASEAEIVSAIEKVGEDRTVVLISHRAGALTGADRVLRVVDGEIRPVAQEGAVL